MARINRRGRLAEIHGMTNTPEYKSWTDMKRRCDDPNRKQFKDYGGRGITYDDRWEYFSEFFYDMGIRPSDGYELDRIDNNGNYCKENCRWILMIKNAQNKGFSDSLRGTYRHHRDKHKFVSQIKINGSMYYLGVFEAEEEAHKEYSKIFSEWYGFTTEKYKECRR